MHDTARFQRRFKLTYGRRTERLHQYPACVAAMAQENETILELGNLKPNQTSVRPPGSTRIDLSWEITKSGLCALSGGLHHSTLDNDAEGDIFPECDQQLSRQRDDCRFPQAATLFDAFPEPQGERRFRLMTQP